MDEKQSQHSSDGNEPEKKPVKKPARKKAAKKTAKKPAKKSAKKISKKVDEKLPLPSPDTLQTQGVNFNALSAFFKAVEDPSVAKHKKAMTNMLGGVEEYLSNFILIGYTLDGKQVSFTCGKTTKDYDSLNTALHKYILDNYAPPPPGPPGNFN